ncbi:unnamed protein product [Brugia timori]|uniref:Uncharacterized protein n=1 Tax=Brugia timori TaxID=42155 RepID=A0A0R3QRD1_9BILA|nr:unnamed protein product [Brugia timori]
MTSFSQHLTFLSLFHLFTHQQTYHLIHEQALIINFTSKTVIIAW